MAAPRKWDEAYKSRNAGKAGFVVLVFYNGENQLIHVSDVFDTYAQALAEVVVEEERWWDSGNPVINPYGCSYSVVKVSPNK